MQKKGMVKSREKHINLKVYKILFADEDIGDINTYVLILIIEMSVLKQNTEKTM